MKRNFTSLFLLCTCLTLASLRAQELAFELSAGQGHDGFGNALAGVGDINGDTVPDFVIGAYGESSILNEAGKVTIYSGVDASILFSFHGQSEGDRLGWDVCGAGDVNQDGVPDIVASAIAADAGVPDCGVVYVFSGADGSTLHTFSGTTTGEAFGQEVAGGADFNLDGYDDLVIGAAEADGPAGQDCGAVWVHSGIDGSVLFQYYGSQRVDSLGKSVDVLDDLNGDGHPEFIAGADQYQFTYSDPGYCRVYSGSDGAVLHHYAGEEIGNNFGTKVSHAGDVNGDGVADFMAGASVTYERPTRGMVRLYSGADGSTIHTFYGDLINSYFGHSFSAAGDVNGDGYDDILLGSPSDSYGPLWQQGIAYVFLSPTFSTLYSLNGDVVWQGLGGRCSDFGDLDGDGLDDFAIAAPAWGNTGGWTGVRVYLSRSPFLSSRLDRINRTLLIEATEFIPNEDILLGWSKTGRGHRYWSLLDVWVDLAMPIRYGKPLITDASGHASWNLSLPKRALDYRLWIQAVQHGLASNVSTVTCTDP